MAFALCYAQVAMAAFAPPARTPGMVQAMAQGMPCHEADAAVAILCIEKNCQDEAQKLEVPSLQPVALPPPTSLRVDPPCDELTRCRELPDSLLKRPGSPPPLILLAHRLE